MGREFTDHMVLQRSMAVPVRGKEVVMLERIGPRTGTGRDANIPESGKPDPIGKRELSPMGSTIALPPLGIRSAQVPGCICIY